MNNDKMREAFEGEAGAYGMNLMRHELDQDQYYRVETQSAWWAYQAGYSAALSTHGQESEAHAWLIEKIRADGTSELEPLYLAAWSHHGQLDEGGYEVVFTKNPYKAIRFDSDKKARGLIHVAENLKATSHIFESEAQADILDEEEFYNICQHYRWAKDNGDAGQAFENLKCFIRRIAPPSAIVIETAAKLQAAEVCIRATPDREMVKGIGEAAHYIASGNAILATIHQDGITELEKFGMRVAETIYKTCPYPSDDKERNDYLHSIVSSLIGEK